MDAAELAELAKRDLAPLLAANAAERVPPRARRRLGGRDAPGNVPWVGIPGGNEIALSRSLPLTPWEAGILQPYGEALSELQGVPDGVARNAKDDVVLRAIASQLGGADRATIETAMRFLLACASTTYEGQPVHLSLLVDLDDPGTAPTPVATLDALRSHDWYALLGSGIDTGVELNAAGGIKGAIDVRHLAPEANGTLIDESLRPDAFRCLAEWATNGRRVALTLARSREILIHQGGILRYIHRSGRWRGLPLMVAQRSGWSSGSRIPPATKRSVLAAVLDASLGHHGACVAVVARNRRAAFDASTAIAQTDLWPSDVRARLVPTPRFSDLSRRHRLELVSMDGATVLDHRGRILAAGSIVQVPGGSSGGGRLAAARALAEFGCALKVSQDGPITLFGRDSTGAVAELLAIA